MRVDIVTLFPEIFLNFLSVSFISSAQKTGRLQVHLTNPRQFGLGRHKSIDDTPYGGGSGMVMRVDVLHKCITHIKKLEPELETYILLLSPQGKPFDQQKAKELSEKSRLIFVCGRYEGFDERMLSYVDEEISLGDFVMMGGEVAAMAILEATVRLIPSVLGNAVSILDESHNIGLLEYPHYTRPVEYDGQEVPPVLLSGHHARIQSWRMEQSLIRTKKRRPDLYKKYMDSAPVLDEVHLKKKKRS